MRTKGGGFTGGSGPNDGEWPTHFLALAGEEGRRKGAANEKQVSEHIKNAAGHYKYIVNISHL
jgi:hypothetical protein